MNNKCPNCGSYKLEKEWTARGCGFLILFGVPIVALLTPGAANFHGGNISFGEMGWIIITSIIIGIIVVVFSYISPQKEFTYTCKNCKYSEKRKV